jgi:5-hydroxyisourate hydrolase-like protein (transthyretin family)
VLRDDETVATTSLANLDDAAGGMDASASVDLPETVSDGTYTVELVVTDEAGRTATVRETTTVQTASPTTIAGDVVNETGAGLPGATVRLYRLSDTDFSEPLGATQTDAAGAYTISTADGDALRRSESYRVRVSADGATANRTVGPLQSGVNDGDIVVTTAGTIVLSDLEPDAVTITDQESLTLSTTVTNTGTTTRTNSVVLRINGTTAGSQTVTLTGGENRTITFDDAAIPELDFGEYMYSVSAGDSRQSGTLTVESGAVGNSVVDQYDDNKNGVIERPELATAATDFALSDGAVPTRVELSQLAINFALNSD